MYETVRTRDIVYCILYISLCVYVCVCLYLSEYVTLSLLLYVCVRLGKKEVVQNSKIKKREEKSKDI